MVDSVQYLTELVGLPVHDVRGKRIGRVKDASVVPVIDPARVDRYLVGAGQTWWTVRHEQVAQISLEGIFLRDEHVTPYHDDESMLRMVRDLLDQQIIDIDGRKVVRVNDVTFEQHRVEGHDLLHVQEVGVGVQSIFRRLAQGLLPPLMIRRLQRPLRRHSIRWEVCNIIEPDPQRRLRLNISHKALEEMHPADLADIVEDLSHEDREAIFESLDSGVAAEALSEVEDPRTQASILESLETDRAVMIVEDMSPNEAADLLSELEEETSERILEEMGVEPKSEVRELLEFEEESAGGMMNTEFVALPRTATASEALAAIRQNERLVDGLTTLFLEDDEGHLAGTVPVARLLLSDGWVPLGELATDETISVPVDEQPERVMEVVDKYNLMALAVVDGQGRLVGTITADDVISLLREG